MIDDTSLWRRTASALSSGRALSLLLALLLGSLPALAAELQEIAGVRLVPTEWADGDSFLVRFPDGSEHTLRLYGADCLESRVTDDVDARRLRAQRRYFGIAGYGGSARSSIELAKSQGDAATREVRALLANPFTIHTAFADAMGDGRYKRIYAFVTTADGKDLAAHLVGQGLARAFGVYRASPQGLAKDDYREVLRDAELLAATQRKGIWAYTDWDMLTQERQAERTEKSESRIAQGTQQPAGGVDLNTAARDELMRVPGIGEATANAIIEGRPYKSIDELVRLKGIGEKKLAKIRPWVSVAQ